MSKIDEQIAQFQKMIDDPRSTDEEIVLYKKTIEKLKKKKADSAPEKKTEAKKPAKKPESAPAKKTEAKKSAKKPKGVKTISTKTVEIDGKKISTDSKEFCDYLLSEWKTRREKAAAQKGKKKKTKSVMEKVSDNIEKGVVAAIKSGIKSKEDQIKKDPKAFIKKVEKLETSTKGFLQDLKEVMGKEYDSKEVTATVKSIHELVTELKKKTAEKK